MEFVETTVFTRRVGALGLETQLKALQEELVANPEAGALEPGPGGLRKVRMGDPARGKGKRGGARVCSSATGSGSSCSTSTERTNPTSSRTRREGMRAVLEAIKREA